MDPNLPQLPISSETGDALAKPIAESVGNAGKDIVEAIFHYFLDPLRKFNIQRNFNLEKFQEDLYKNFNDIPEENRDDSKINLTIKAIEDLRYQINEEEIRDMFTTLVTSTLDNRKNSKVLPIFSTIISNMTSSEAKLLKVLYTNKLSLTPYVELTIVNKISGVTNAPGLALLLLDESNTQGAELDLSLLESENLIKHTTDSSLSSGYFVRRYEAGERILSQIVEQNPDVPSLKINADQEIRFVRSIYELTPIGKVFCDIVFEQ